MQDGPLPVPAHTHYCPEARRPDAGTASASASDSACSGPKPRPAPELGSTSLSIELPFQPVSAVAPSPADCAADDSAAAPPVNNLSARAAQRRCGIPPPAFPAGSRTAQENDRKYPRSFRRAYGRKSKPTIVFSSPGRLRDRASHIWIGGGSSTCAARAHRPGSRHRHADGRAEEQRHPVTIRTARPRLT